MAMAVLLAVPLTAAAAGSQPGHDGPAGQAITHRMMMLAIQVGVILFAAKIGGLLLSRIHLPGALGELISGILIGPYLLGRVALPGLPGGLFPLHGLLPVSPELYGLCALAAVVLLFTAGLETDVGLLLRYCLSAGLVGVGGVAAAFALGVGATWLLSEPLLGEAVGPLDPRSLLLGVILTATSVGISARILSDRRQMDSPEGVTILSAAVIDDVIGIILLAVVLGITTASKSGGIDWGHIGTIGAKAVGVWLAATLIGLLAARKISFVLKWFGRRTTVAVMALGLALILAGLFEEAGLAMIVGAYVMGLSLSRSDISHMVREKLHPVYELLVPIFFCVMGMRIDLGVLGSPTVLLFGLAYAAAALGSKVLGCGLPAMAGNFTLRGALRIGFGMAPRCEVALIVAGIGLSAGVLTGELFAAVIVMVLVNSIVAPAALAGLYRSDEPGTRRQIASAGARLRETLFELPSADTAEFLTARLTRIFEQEGYYVHRLERERRLYQLRKDAAVIDLLCEQTQLTFTCHEADVGMINTAMYEAVAEMERAVRGLREPLDSGAIATRLMDEDAPDGRQMLNLKQYLRPELIVPRLRGSTKAEIIDELLDVLDRARLVSDVSAAREAVWRREQSMSTGLQHGVAIPHGKTDAVDRLVCSAGLKPEGMDFDSMDGRPARIFILTISPASRPAPHVQFMSTVSRILTAEGRQRILSCDTAEQLCEAFTAATAPRRLPSRDRFRLTDYLSIDAVEPRLSGTTGEEVIDELLRLVKRTGRIVDFEAARKAVLDREKLMSTGVGDGVAIPHGRTDAVESLVCAVGVRREGVDFGAVDGQPVRIFVLALTPEAGSDPYLQFVAAVVAALDDEGRQRALSARTPDQLHEALTRR